MASNENSLNEEIIKNELEHELGENEYFLYPDNSNYQLEIKGCDTYYTILPNYSVEPREWIKYNENNVLKVKRGDLVIELGDYINYNQTDYKDENNHITEYKSLATKNGSEDQNFVIDETVKWRVLDVDEKGNLKIISSPIQTEDNKNYALKGRLAYCNAVDELNKICELYGQGYGASSVRSVNYNDIVRLDGYAASKDSSKVGTIGEDGILYTFYWENNNLYFKTSNGKNGINLTFGTFYYYDENSQEWKESTKKKDYTEIVTIKNNNKGHSYNFKNDKVKNMMSLVFGDGYYLANVQSTFDIGTYIWQFQISNMCHVCNLNGWLVSSRNGELEDKKKIRAVVTLEPNMQLKKDNDGVWQFDK